MLGYCWYLVGYWGWATNRVLERAAAAGPDAFTASYGAVGSLRSIALHLWFAERLWLSLIREGRMPSPLTETDFPDAESLRAGWQSDHEAWRAFLAGASEDDLTKERTSFGPNGPFSFTVLGIVTQLTGHGTQHRAEMAWALTALGHSPGDLDLIVFIRHNRPDATVAASSAYMRELFAFNRWANEKVLAAAANVDTSVMHAERRYGQGSLHSILTHLWSAEWTWRSRLQDGVSPAAALSPAEFPTFQALREGWAAESDRLAAYINSLTEEDLAAEVSYRRIVGGDDTNRRSALLAHLANHGVQHRAEAAMIFTEAGHSPGDLDFIQFQMSQAR